MAISILVCLSAMLAACGGGSSVSSPDDLSGNWQISLQRHALPGLLQYSGFLLQSGDSVTGSVILGGGCQGVGPITGTFDGQNLSLTISEFGQDVSLTGTVPAAGPSSSTFVSGAFSSLAGGCADFASTGTWSAVRVAPLSGSFHGTIVGIPAANSTDIFNVTGTITQGPNTGSSNAMLSGTVTATGAPHFCGYLTTATIVGLISGTEATLGLFGPSGSQITQISPVSVNPAGTLLTCSQGATTCFNFPAISSACSGEPASIQVSFP